MKKCFLLQFFEEQTIMKLYSALGLLNKRSVPPQIYRHLSFISYLRYDSCVPTRVLHLKLDESSSSSRVLRSSITKREFTSFMSQVKELRSASGAPIVDCKKALTETGGDIDKSLDWLRQHGSAKASKKLGDREADEGLVACAVSEDRRSASIVKISSETDFAGKSDAFVSLACHVANATLSSNASGDLDPKSSVLKLEYKSKSVQTALEEAIVALRENLGVKKAIKLTTEDDGLLAAYVHGKANVNKDAGLAAAVVEISGTGIESNFEAANDIGKKLAMHIVAAKPTYLSSECIPKDIIEKERAIFESQVADSAKTPEVIEKIINGRMRKFYSEVCLVDQEHLIEEGNPRVSKLLKDKELSVGCFEILSI